MIGNVLSLAFIDRKPVAAARALAALTVAEAAAFLQTIPTRYATRVLDRVSAWPASKMLLSMPPSAAAGILRAMPYLDSVAILRLMRPEERDALLTQLPSKLRRDLKVTMSYPNDTVGGHMCVDIVTLNRSHTVADARDALSKATTINADTLFLVDGKRSYVGSIAVHELFRHADETTVADLAINKAPPLLARQSLSSAAGLEGWNESSSLPVLGRSRHLVGSLPIKQLLLASPQSGRRGSSMGGLIEAYFGAATSLLELYSGRQSGSHQSKEHSA